MSKNKKSNLIVSRERVKKYAEVFTPDFIVKQMCDLFPHEIWQNIDSTFLEPCCGKGTFVKEILARKLSICNDIEQGKRALRSIYCIDIQQDNVDDTRTLMVNMFLDKFATHDLIELNEIYAIVERNVICGDALVICKQLETVEWDDLKI